MSLLLTDDEKMLRESAEGFFADKAPVAQLRTLRDTRDPLGYSPELWAEMAAMGFAGVLVPEDAGGVDMGFMAAGLLAEQMGRNLSASPFLSTSVLATTALRAAGSAQAAELLKQITAGQTIVALAVDEGRKHNPAGIETMASPSGNGFKICGAKSMVIDGHVADHIIVAAKTDAGLGLFVVPKDAAGLTVERTLMVDSRNAARLTLDEVEVDGAQLIGSLEDGEAILQTALNGGRAIIAAEMLGAASQVFEQTNEYLKERKQFGRIIGEFQALQHRLAHLYCETELARTAVLAALRAMDKNPKSAGPFVAMAKAKLSDVARLAALEAVQLHGGMGMTDELDIGLYLKRIRVLQELLGDADYHTGHLYG